MQFGARPCIEFADMADRDLVDTEPYENGNVLKMLLGPVNDWFDDDRCASRDPKQSPDNRASILG